jgi:hypothetical protein
MWVTPWDVNTMIEESTLKENVVKFECAGDLK